MNHGGHTKDSEINLLGYEGPPTLEDRHVRLEKELKHIELSQEKLNILFGKKNINFLQEMNTLQKNEVIMDMHLTVKINTGRLRDLRELKVKKILSREKFKKAGGDEWAKSKYAFVISYLQTDIVLIDRCCSSLLTTNDQLLSFVAELNGDPCYVKPGLGMINLGMQANHYCLKEPQQIQSTTVSVFEKQRTENWFQRRLKAKVTGINLLPITFRPVYSLVT